MSFFENTRKPTGFSGKIMVNMMNLCHASLADWGMEFLPLSSNARVLDWGWGATGLGVRHRHPQGRCRHGAFV